MHNEQTEGTPYVAWGIVEAMLESFTDDQLLVMDRLVRSERRERFRRPDPRQWELWGGQAVRREVAR